MVQVIWFIVSVIVSYYASSQMMKNRQKRDPLTEKDVDIPQIDEGTPQAVLHGDCWTSGWTVLGWGNLQSEGVKEHGQIAYYKYSITLLMGLWRGPIDALKWITANNAYIGNGGPDTAGAFTFLNKPDAFGGYKKQGGVSGLIYYQYGGPNQQPNLNAQTWLGHALPAYRGRTTVVYNGYIAANTVSPYAWSFRGHRTVSGWARGCWYPEKCEVLLSNPHDMFPLADQSSSDYSPAQADMARQIHAKNGIHVLYEALTDPLWGKGKDPALLDDAVWKAEADRCFAEGMGLCINWQITDDVDSFMQSVCDHIGAGIYQSVNNKLIKVRLFRDDYDVNTIRSFSPSSGLLSIDSIDESTLSEAVSEIIVSWKDPVTNQQRSTRQQNLGLLQVAPVISQSTNYPYIPTIELANRVASRDLRAKGLGVRSYSMKLDRSAASLEPGEVIAISSLPHGIVRDIVRVVNIDYGSSTEGEVMITAAQDVFGLPSTTYITPQGLSWSPPPKVPAVIMDYAGFEQNYRDLVLQLGQPAVDALPLGAGYISTVAIAPNGASSFYKIQSKLPNEAGFLDSSDVGQFAVRGVVSSAVQTRQRVDVTLGDIDLTQIEVGRLARWDNELVMVENITGQTVTLGRGCVDTVPTPHSAGSYVWFYDGQTADIDRAFARDDQVSYRILAQAGSVGIDPALETVHNYTINGRIELPYPPRQVNIEGRWFGEGDTATDGEILYWSPSNRKVQASVVFAHQDAGVLPEAGTTWNLRITDGNGGIIVEMLNTTDTTYMLPAITGSGNWTVELWSSRDGLDSLQKHVFTIPYASGLRVTSHNDVRTTSDGSNRVVS